MWVMASRPRVNRHAGAYSFSGVDANERGVPLVILLCGGRCLLATPPFW